MEIKDKDLKKVSGGHGVKREDFIITKASRSPIGLTVTVPFSTSQEDTATGKPVEKTITAN